MKNNALQEELGNLKRDFAEQQKSSKCDAASVRNGLEAEVRSLKREVRILERGKLDANDNLAEERKHLGTIAITVAQMLPPSKARHKISVMKSLKALQTELTEHRNQADAAGPAAEHAAEQAAAQMRIAAADLVAEKNVDIEDAEARADSMEASFKAIARELAIVRELYAQSEVDLGKTQSELLSVYEAQKFQAKASRSRSYR